MPIRLMSMDDYPAAFALWSATEGMRLRVADDSADGVARFLVRKPRACFVADENDRIAGAVLSGHDGGRGFPYHTAVDPAWRRHDLGRALAAFRDGQPGNGFRESLGFSRRTDQDHRHKRLNPENG